MVLAGQAGGELSGDGPVAWVRTSPLPHNANTALDANQSQNYAERMETFHQDQTQEKLSARRGSRDVKEMCFKCLLIAAAAVIVQ